MRYTTIFAVAFALVVSRAALAAGASEKPRLPNIVFVLADDMGFGDVGCQNPHSKIPTPRLDRFASEGVRFTDAHDPTSVCTPSRYGILTGRYCWRSRLKKGVLKPWEGPLIEGGRLTVPALLHRAGYDTAIIGKWHLGMTWATTDGKPAHSTNTTCNVDFSKPIAGGPTTRGFDYYFGVDVPNYPPYCFIENDRLLGTPTEYLNPKKWAGPAFGPLETRPGPAVAGWDLVKILPTLADHAVSYIEGAHRSKDRPFFLYFPLTAPHCPIVPAPEFRGKSGIDPYGDLVCQVDAVMGRVLDALDKAGVADNTIVIFTSDNGPEAYAYNRLRKFHHASMGDLRGVKRDDWEGGHRVPYIVRWPGHVKPGTTSGEVICQTDLMATCAALVGAKLPADAGEDSYNILPALLGEKLDRPIREATVHCSMIGYLAIRQGPWVLIDHSSGEDYAKREPQWFRDLRGYKKERHEPKVLYNLQQDPQEAHNLYADHPDIVQHLQQLLDQYQRDGRSTPVPR